MVVTPAPPVRLATQLPDGAADQVRYTVLMMGQPAGVQISSVTPAGERRFFYEYNDRGRGPRLTTSLTLDSAGMPTHVETTGFDYLKAPVNEQFSLTDGLASWQNKGEQGRRAVTERAFYVSLDAAPGEQALLAQALLATPAGRLPLLPDGEARIERVGELKLDTGGRTRTVTHYAISGLGFAPVSIWLDEGHQFFALASQWSAVVREGWEASVPALLKAQNVYEGVRAEALAQTLTHEPATALVFKGARLFDTETCSTRPHTTVVISGRRIVAVGDDGKIKIPPHAEVIDAQGKTLMPGLWDMHVHLSAGDGLQHMAAGVTTVRDLANDTDSLLALRRRFDAGTEIGPRVLMAGFMDGRGTYAAPTKVFVDTVAEAQAAIDKYDGLGYVQIKIYSSIKPELVPKIVALAHQHGLRISGHVPAFMTAEQFVRAGVDEIQHINFILLNFLFDKIQDTRTPARFTVVAEHGAEIDLESAQVKSFIQLLQDRHVVVDPTVSVFEEMFDARRGSISPGYAPVADRLPPLVRRKLLGGGLPVPEGMNDRYRASFKTMLKMVGALYRAGVPLVAGTDTMPGFPLHRELELYVAAGIPAPKVLQLATLGAAQIMKRDRELGSVKPGKLADLILLDGDPATRISDIRRVTLVVKGGRVYRVAALHRALSVKP
ncbi:MAG TPA: amidohydrolase family protein [Pyrinomonadaceae bacterium]